MKKQTSELTGAALDWSVSKCEGHSIQVMHRVPYIVSAAGYTVFKPSSYWSQGGEIIEREKIELRRGNQLYFPQGNERGEHYEPLWIAGKMHGQTALIAGMRCYVESKLGREVDIPDELEETK